MGMCCLYFLSKVNLTEKYFQVSAKQMLLTKAELNAFGRLIDKGYFSKSHIDRLKKEKKIASSVSVDDVEEPKEMDARIRDTIARARKQNVNFVITEDGNLRPHLEKAGINVISCVDIIFHMAKKGAISKEESRQSLHSLRSFGWYEDDVLLKIINEVEKL